MKYKLLFITCVLLSINSLLFAEEIETFYVIVHASNPHSKLTKEEISILFLKKITRWKETNELVYPVDQLKNSSLREEFSRDVHQKKISAIKAYWQQQIFSGREVPPMEKASDQEVLKYVEQKSGAIGYVSASVDIHEYEVKVIDLIEKE